MSLTIELPEILDDKHPMARLIKVLDKEGNVLGRIKSLNTKTLKATVYKLEKDDRGVLKVSNDNSDILTEDIQLEDVTIKIEKK